VKPRRASAGFTLVELLVSVAIVGLLASVAVPMTELVLQRSKERDLRSALREIRSGIDAYKRASDEGRITTDALASGYPKTLQSLVDGVTDARSPGKSSQLYFLRRIPRDPFADAGADPATGWGKRAYASPPDQPSEGDDVFDVFSQSRETGLNGVRYQSW
jgi:general secretion pathway protein G